MKADWKKFGLTAVGALALLQTVPSHAGVVERSQEVDVYAGEVFGDDVTNTAVSGRTPKLDDDLTYGLRYGYNFTKNWGLEAALGYNTNSVRRIGTSDVDVDITTLDLDAVYHFDLGSRFVPYALAGIGYASASLDNDLTGTVNGQPVTIHDDDGFTFNAGIGAKYYQTDHLLFRVEGRYRYLDKIVDNFDSSLNTFETTLSVGYQF